MHCLTNKTAAEIKAKATEFGLMAKALTPPVLAGMTYTDAQCTAQMYRKVCYLMAQFIITNNVCNQTAIMEK